MGGGGFQTFVCLFLVLFSNIISLSNAYGFKVGGKDGWTLNPSENYNTWSKRQRFLINDTLTFKYPKGSDSVLAVTKDDYDNCNINNPITKLDDGDSVFKLDRSGPFYFISGNKSNCDQGQKISLVVISLRVRGPPKPPLAPPPPPPPPVPTSPPPAIAPVSSPPSPATAITPVSSPPSPPPAITPVSSPPSPPPAITPVSSPPSPPPATTPVSSPPSPATTPASSPTSPEIPATPSPGSETPVKSAPGPSGPPVAPPHMSFAAAAFTPSVVLVASVYLVMALGSFATSC